MTERSVTRAGQRVGLRQPAVSNALGRLRQLFGDELFIKTASGMLPTARAEALAMPIRAALETILGAPCSRTTISHRRHPSERSRSV
jgi:DNA-binding transcriptional LysR family regulator